MIGEYRIALVLEMYTGDGWETCFFYPHCEEALKYYEFPSEYCKYLTIDFYVFVSMLEGLNKYLDEKK